MASFLRAHRRLKRSISRRSRFDGRPVSQSSDGIVIGGEQVGLGLLRDVIARVLRPVHDSRRKSDQRATRRDPDIARRSVVA